nr:RNA-directed DNA polymerase, eukaryota, reverse transcriptase zinc-binding domain protein [Tanacetum cinerariifolium]
VEWQKKNSKSNTGNGFAQGNVSDETINIKNSFNVLSNDGDDTNDMGGINVNNEFESKLTVMMFPMVFKGFAWNIRGLNNVHNQDQVIQLLREDKYSFCGLLETHVKERNLPRICNLVLGNWSWASNCSSCSSGTRIIVGWDPSCVNMMVIEQTPQVMHCFVDPVNGDPRFFCSFVYAFVNTVDRRCLRKSLSIFKGIVKDKPWTILGMHGLRQGDPLSLYLFTLTMEVQNLVLIREIKKNPSFRYHWLCKEVKLTHLCFVDDLLLFCNGDSKSMSVMKNALAEFSSMSGLLPNCSKSTVFFRNVRDGCRRKTLGIMPFKEGTLPVRYLGVPLISKRLYVKDFHVLIDKARKRILDWKNKSLSFAGRLQLIKFVISSMQVYWASMFILPVSISSDIEKLMRDFLWNFRVFKRGKSLINWNSVCMMKVKGGLGIKSLY